MIGCTYAKKYINTRIYTHNQLFLFLESEITLPRISNGLSGRDQNGTELVSRNMAYTEKKRFHAEPFKAKNGFVRATELKNSFVHTTELKKGFEICNEI